MRTIKCKVFISSNTPFKRIHITDIYGKFAALRWINCVGWGHVSAGLCEYDKCVKSKIYIDNKQLVPGKNNKAILNPVYTYPKF